MKLKLFSFFLLFTFFTLSSYTKNMAVKGLWNILGYNLPDYGINEWLGIGPRNVAVTSPNAFQAPLPYGLSPNMSQKTDMMSRASQLGGTNVQGPLNQSTTQTVPNSYSSPSPSPSPDQSNKSPELDLYTQQWLAGLENAKRQAQSLRSQGQNTFQRLIDAARGYSERAAELRDLGSQQITNTFNELAGGNARLGQDARQQALLRARAGGYGDSSKLGLLNQVTGNLAGMQGSALARKGENEALNLADYKAREAEAEQQRKAAQDYMTGIEEAAGELERQGIQNVGYDYGQNLSGLAQRLQAMQAMNPLNAQSLTQYTPDYSGLTNTLNSLLSGLTAQNRASGADQALTAVQPTTYQELLRRIRGTYGR